MPDGALCRWGTALSEVEDQVDELQCQAQKTGTALQVTLQVGAHTPVTSHPEVFCSTYTTAICQKCIYFLCSYWRYCDIFLLNYNIVNIFMAIRG